MEFWRKAFRFLRTLKPLESSLAASHSQRWHSFSIDGFCECRQQSRHEAKVELADLGRIRHRLGRFFQLHILLCEVSDHARFSVGKSPPFLRRRNSASYRSV